MINLITAALQKAVAAFERGDVEGYAFHTGNAGGVAAAIGVYGIKSLSMCDDISDAYETSNSGLMSAILAEATERLDNPDTGARVMDSGAISWPKYGAALNQAVESKAAGDELRFALMTGFVSGLLFNNPGPGHPEHGTILEAVTTAYETGSDDSLQYAQARIGAGVRHSDPTPFMPPEQYARYREERMRLMRWLQNFGLRQARAGDQRVAIPGSMAINDVARQQAQRENNAETHYNRGVSKMGQRDYEGAIADLDRSLELKSDNMIAFANRAFCKQAQGDYTEAIVDFGRAIELAPDDAGQYFNRAIAEEVIGDYDGVIADCDRAIELEPDYDLPYALRGTIKMRRDDYEGAILDFDRAIELSPGYSAVYIDRGLAKSRTGDYGSAMADFDRAVELKSDDARAHDYRGYAKMNVGDYEGAIADFNRALEIDPSDEYAQQMRDTARSEAES